MQRLALLACLGLARGAPLCAEKNGYKVIWSVDRSQEVSTSSGIIRGDKGLPITRWNQPGYNGASITVYGGKGKLPHYASGNVSINGGTPQDPAASLPDHISQYNIHLNALQTDANYEGYVWLDYEQWRADWNSTSPFYRQQSVYVAQNDKEEAMRAFNESAQLFLAETIKATRALRPNVKVGFYGYPRNYVPHIPDVGFWNWCGWNPGTCWFYGYSLQGPIATTQEAIDAQMEINDMLVPFLDHLDAITPSIYLGIPEAQTTPEVSEAYINSTVREARRLADKVLEYRREKYGPGSAAPDPSKVVRPEVIPFAWYCLNNYWQVAGPTAREFLSAADARREFMLPMYHGADGVIVWGAIDSNPIFDGTAFSVAGLQQYVDNVLDPLVEEIHCVQGFEDGYVREASTTTAETTTAETTTSTFAPLTLEALEGVVKKKRKTVVGRVRIAGTRFQAMLEDGVKLRRLRKALRKDIARILSIANWRRVKLKKEAIGSLIADYDIDADEEGGHDVTKAEVDAKMAEVMNATNQSAALWETEKEYKDANPDSDEHLFIIESTASDVQQPSTVCNTSCVVIISSVAAVSVAGALGLALFCCLRKKQRAGAKIQQRPSQAGAPQKEEGDMAAECAMKL